MQNIIIVSYSIVAALIGAGFASGQEVLCYFVASGRTGIWGLLSASLFFGLFIFIVLYFCITSNTPTYREFLRIFKTPATRRGIKIVTVIFSLAVYSAMLSALAEVLSQSTGMSTALSGLLATVIATMIFTRGTDQVFALNGIIGIGLVFFMVFATMYILVWREIHVFSPALFRATTDGIVYGGYNLVSMTPILVALSRRLRTKSDAVAVSLTTTFIATLLMSLVFVLLSMYHNRINLGSLPMLTLAKRQSVGFGAFYTVILSCAILTTLLSSGGAVIDSLAIKRKPIYIATVSALAFALSGIGFANLINIAYRLCGIAGIFVCGATIFAIIKRIKSVKTNKDKNHI